MGSLKTLSASEYYLTYYNKNKLRYKNYYQEKLLREQKNNILFESHGGEEAYYKNQYKKFVDYAKKEKEDGEHHQDN